MTAPYLARMTHPFLRRGFPLVLTVCLLAACAGTRPLPRAALYRAVGAPGVRQVRDSLFIDETEVANIHWLEYLVFVRRDSGEAFYRSQLPDSAAYPRVRAARTAGAAPADTAAPSYLRYPGFRYYPVVGISHAQAQAYCRWRTRMVGAQLADPRRPGGTFYGPRRKLLARYDVTVTYALPTPAEWEMAAGAPAPATAAPGPAAPVEVYAGPAAAAGLRHLADNVAELTARSAVVKGGSWYRPGVPPAADQPNPGPRPWLGFRCACVLRVLPRSGGPRP